MFLHLQNVIHVTLYIIRRAFISSSPQKTMYTKMSNVHGSSVLTVILSSSLWWQRILNKRYKYASDLTTAKTAYANKPT